MWQRLRESEEKSRAIGASIETLKCDVLSAGQQIVILPADIPRPFRKFLPPSFSVGGVEKVSTPSPPLSYWLSLPVLHSLTPSSTPFRPLFISSHLILSHLISSHPIASHLIASYHTLQLSRPRRGTVRNSERSLTTRPRASARRLQVPPADLLLTSLRLQLEEAELQVRQLERTSHVKPHVRWGRRGGAWWAAAEGWQGGERPRAGGAAEQDVRGGACEAGGGVLGSAGDDKLQALLESLMSEKTALRSRLEGEV
eukprot:745827-Hanusia_phi.AAC.3